MMTSAWNWEPRAISPCFLVQLAHRAGHGRVDRGLGEIVARLLERGPRLRHLLERRLVARHLDLVGGLLRVEVRLRLQVPRASSSFERANSFCARSMFWWTSVAFACGGAHVGLGALDRREVAFAIELDQERALLDPLALDDGELLDLRAHVGADLDLGLGLDLARGADLLDDLLRGSPSPSGLRAPLCARLRSGNDHCDADHEHERRRPSTRALRFIVPRSP